MKRIVWANPAKADVRSLDKTTAMRILTALDRFAETGAGDVKALIGTHELRLRIGNYRVIFVYPSDGAIEIRRVLHRREAYR